MIEPIPLFVRRRRATPKAFSANLSGLAEGRAYAQAVVRGHTNYYGVPGNAHAITAFRLAIIRIWRRTLSRRSQKGKIAWTRMQRLIAQWVPFARVRYKDPDGHLRVITQGKSPVR